jgi:hypothetical protein
MPTYECAACGGEQVTRSYRVMAVEVQCPDEDCAEFCPHVDLDHPRVSRLVEKSGIERSASAVVDAIRGRL